MCESRRQLADEPLEEDGRGEDDAGEEGEVKRGDHRGSLKHGKRER